MDRGYSLWDRKEVFKREKNYLLIVHDKINSFLHYQSHMSFTGTLYF